jgi:uncharacterized protein
MGQLLRIVVILVGLWLVLSIIKRALATRRHSPADKLAVAKMVACGHCGTHIPESEAVSDGNRHYCSEEHRRKNRA